MRASLLCAALLAGPTGCTPPETPDGPAPYAFPAPEDRPDWVGSGGPARTFAPDELWASCAYLPGPPNDRGHRNTVVPWRGHLIVPYAHEAGFGGLSFWDVADPCAPVATHQGEHRYMRETHALGMVHLPDGDPHAGDYAVANGVLGIVFLDMTDLEDIHEANYLILDGVIALDSYARTAFMVFWQYPYVFLASTDNGLIIVDATDPYAPFEAARFQLDPILRMGGVWVNGNQALITSAGESEAAVIDLSDPLDPQLVSRFPLVDGSGTVREAYSGILHGEHAYFARKDDGSGPLVYDLSDPSAPTFVSEVVVEGSGGGYVFVDEGIAFIGQTNRADVYDFTDLTSPVHLGRGDLVGDLDTLTPYGNVAILAVDDEGVDGQEMAVLPWSLEPDTTPPAVLSVNPPDGAVGVRTTARVGVALSEAVEPSSVFPGSFVLHGPDGRAVPGWAGGGEGFGWFTPKQPLEPATTYTAALLAGGVVDLNGNAVAADVTWTFTTGDR